MNRLPASPAVYAAYAGDECLYVGASMNVCSRWNGHPRRKEMPAETELRFWLCSPSELRDLEQSKIEELKPRMNSKKYPGYYPIWRLSKRDQFGNQIGVAVRRLVRL